MKHFIASVVGFQLLASVPALAAVITVPGDFDEIDDAVLAAQPGDIIEVGSGTYTERTEILQASSLTLQGVDTGDGLPIVRPGEEEEGFRVKGSSDITITGFRFENAKHGVSIRGGSTNIEVVTNEFAGQKASIRVRGGSGHILLGNAIFESDTGGGIRVRRTSNVQIDGNTLNSLLFDGIRVREADDVTVTDNTIDDCSGDGIEVRDSTNIVIGNLALGGNVVTSSEQNGIRVKASQDVTVSQNDTRLNRRYGIRTRDAAPIDAPGDLAAAGNTSVCNELGDFRVNLVTLTNICDDDTTTTTTTSTSTSTTTTTLP